MDELALRFEPEYVPDAAECMALTASVKLPGFLVEQRLMKSVVDQFLVDARNADTSSPRDCQEKLRRSQVAAHVYQLFVDKVNMCVIVGSTVDAVNEDEVAPDITEELGMSEPAAQYAELEGVENLFHNGPEEGLF